jgi:hypothetical protein
VAPAEDELLPASVVEELAEAAAAAERAAECEEPLPLDPHAEVVVARLGAMYPWALGAASSTPP